MGHRCQFKEWQTKTLSSERATFQLSDALLIDVSGYAAWRLQSLRQIAGLDAEEDHGSQAHAVDHKDGYRIEAEIYSGFTMANSLTVTLLSKTR